MCPLEFVFPFCEAPLCCNSFNPQIINNKLIPPAASKLNYTAEVLFHVKHFAKVRSLPPPAGLILCEIVYHRRSRQGPSARPPSFQQATPCLSPIIPNSMIMTPPHQTLYTAHYFSSLVCNLQSVACRPELWFWVLNFGFALPVLNFQLLSHLRIHSSTHRDTIYQRPSTNYKPRTSHPECGRRAIRYPLHPNYEQWTMNQKLIKPVPRETFFAEAAFWPI